MSRLPANPLDNAGTGHVRIRRRVLRAVGAVAFATASIAVPGFGSPAHAAAPCPTTAPTTMLGTSRDGATWVENGVLVASSSLHCKYVGDLYQVSRGTSPQYYGDYYFVRIR